jgi:hypothetical protein
MKSFVRASRRLAPTRDFHDKASGYLKNHFHIFHKEAGLTSWQWLEPMAIGGDYQGPAMHGFALSGLDALDKIFFLW